MADSSERKQSKWSPRSVGQIAQTSVLFFAMMTSFAYFVLNHDLVFDVESTLVVSLLVFVVGVLILPKKSHPTKVDGEESGVEPTET